MHPDQEQLQRYLHHELPASRADLIRTHLRTCAECRAQVAAAEGQEAEVNSLFEQLDHATTPITALEIALAARNSGLQRYRRAAAVLLALGLASAAYAIPGSPVPAWVRSILASSRDSAPQPQTTVPQLEPQDNQAGIDVEPGRYLVIDFDSPQTQGNAMVSLTDSGSVMIRSENSAAGFTSGPDRVVVANRGGSADFRIQIPRNAPHVEVRVGNRRIFLMQGATITADGPADAGGVYALSLNPPR